MTDPLPPSPPAGSPGDDERAAAKQAMAWTHTARFLTTASKLSELPVSELPEIAFVGRSNAGKSTAINSLTQHKRLAFASKTPGRTQHINKLRWQEVMAEYLAVRRSLSAIVVLVDARLGFTEIDRKLLGFIAPRLANGSVKLLALLTKADKLNRSETGLALQRANEVLAEVTTEESEVALAAFSALSRAGVDDAARVLHGWVRAAAGGATQAPVAGEALPAGMSQS